MSDDRDDINIWRDKDIKVVLKAVSAMTAAKSKPK